MKAADALRRALPGLLYGALTLAICWPLLAPGYVFALDHAMGPASADYYARYVLHNDDPIQSKGGYALLVAGLDAILPLEVAQRLLLFAPFLLAGLGAHRMARGLGASAPAALLGGALYLLSPFAYVRGVSGQMGVLWAYALAPWFAHAYFRATETGSRRAIAAAVLLLSLTAVFQAHGVFLLLGLVALHTGATLLRQPAAWRASLRVPALALGLAALVNAYWLVPTLLASETTLTRIAGEDLGFFATRDAGLPSVGLAALTLQGFWREGYAAYYGASPALLAIPLAVLVLAVHGAVTARRDPRVQAIAAAGVVGFLLAIGTASRATAPLFEIAWDHVPFFKGFRDAHKLLALLALAYAALAPLGADALLSAARGIRVGRLAAPALAVALVAAPVAAAAASPLMGAYGGQWGATEYPADWVQAEAMTRECDGAMLVLPWHQYLDLRWVPNPDKRVTNPAKVFFSCPVLAGDNVEAGSIATQSPSPVSRYVEHWLHAEGLAHGNPKGIHTFGNLLAPLNVQYILVLKEAEWRQVDAALRDQSDLRLAHEGDQVLLYENAAPRASVVRSDEVHPIASWSDLVPLSERMPLASALFPMDDAPVEAAAYVSAAPAPGAKLAGLRLDGEGPAFASLGFVPAFRARGDAVPADGAMWRVAAPAWAVSGLTAAALVGAAALEARRRARDPAEAAA